MSASSTLPPTLSANACRLCESIAQEVTCCNDAPQSTHAGSMSSKDQNVFDGMASDARQHTDGRISHDDIDRIVKATHDRDFDVFRALSEDQVMGMLQSGLFHAVVLALSNAEDRLQLLPILPVPAFQAAKWLQMTAMTISCELQDASKLSAFHNAAVLLAKRTNDTDADQVVDCAKIFDDCVVDVLSHDAGNRAFVVSVLLPELARRLLDDDAFWSAVDMSPMRLVALVSYVETGQQLGLLHSLADKKHVRCFQHITVRHLDQVLAVEPALFASSLGVKFSDEVRSAMSSQTLAALDIGSVQFSQSQWPTHKWSACLDQSIPGLTVPIDIWGALVEFLTAK